MDNFTFYIKQGFFHVLDLKAVDHILFFIALVVIYSFRDWKKSLGLITFFTIGHSITFGLSSYNYFDINIDIVDFLIPITILIPLVINIKKAVDDTTAKHNNLNIYFAFFFGLIHGLGFSNFLKMYLDKGDDILIPLIKFSIGIELVQILIVFITLFLGHIFQYLIFPNLKNKKRIWIISISLLVIIYIIPMLIERFPF